MSDEKEKGLRFRRLITVLTVVWLLFIWCNSAMPAAVSNWLSDSLIRLFGGTSSEMSAAASPISFLVRKAAHFSEFGALAVLVSLFYRSFPIASWTRRWMTLFTGLLCPLIDETVQSFNDRTSSVRDVWIDFAGYCAGLAILALILKLLAKRKEKKKGLLP